MERLQSGSHGEHEAQNAIGDRSCYVESVTPRHMVLVAAAVAVLGLGVYLYVAVNSTSPAVANGRSRSPDPKASPREDGPRPTKSSDEKRPAVATNGTAQKVNGAIREVAAPAVGGETPSLASAERPGANIDIKKDEMMASANKAYDHGDFDEAMTIAKKVLSNDPANTRMLRIMVSSSCILGDSATAQANYLTLPIGGNDRADMKKRCERYGISFTET